jgi:hypothetical protein
MLQNIIPLAENLEISSFVEIKKNQSFVVTAKKNAFY